MQKINLQCNKLKRDLFEIRFKWNGKFIASKEISISIWVELRGHEMKIAPINIKP
jgi:hypothetical protein